MGLPRRRQFQPLPVALTLLSYIGSSVQLHSRSVAAWVYRPYGSRSANAYSYRKICRTRGSTSRIDRSIPSVFSKSCIAATLRDDDMERDRNGRPLAKVLVSNAISDVEITTILSLIRSTVWNVEGDDNMIYGLITSASSGEVELERASLDETKLPLGATGRSLILQLDGEAMGYSELDDEAIIAWQAELSERMDSLMYGETPSLGQPVLLGVEWKSSADVSREPSEQLLSIIQSHVDDFGLNQPLHVDHSPDLEVQFEGPLEHCYIPTLRYDVDGAFVTDNSNDSLTAVWDTSSFVIWDQLVSDNLRKRLLATVLGRDNPSNNLMSWDDVANGPDPTRWVQGGLVDIPTEDDEKRDEERPASELSFGLTEEALDELCSLPPPNAVQDFELILAKLFPDFVVTRLSESVLGACVTPLTANAPCSGQVFARHIDADPFYAPPSPWTDVYGRYPNRATGKPRFVSCLVYLSDVWKSSDWGAPTRFYDVATDTAIDVEAKPGRIIIMDQDITHTVVAPMSTAGKQARYSLVWKLVLHPRQHDQDMRNTMFRNGWPEPTLIGSANA